MAKLVRFGKPVAPMLSIKRSFFEDNDAMLAWQRDIAAFYLAQPKRISCMTCAAPLAEPAFYKLGVPYMVCRNCGHLNGAHQDTDAFVQRIYTAAEGSYYAGAYASADEKAFNTRVENIYDPKAAFLLDGLNADDADPKSLRFADVGSGSGYFLKALLNHGVRAPAGYEVSQAQVRYSNQLVPGATCHHSPMTEILTLAGKLEQDVVSMIGVLEHLQKPRDFLAALRGNPNVRYLFLALPLHSPTTFIELAFPNVMQRQLSGDHTHLYTESSIDHLCVEFGMSRIAEWWFGTDVMDLYRSLAVTLNNEAANAMMLPLIDPMQEAIDRRKASSEVHMLLAFAR